MYHPIFRGKMFELIAIRELCAEFPDDISSGFVVPIIEPVKESLKSLDKVIDVLAKGKAEAYFIVNPSVGFFSGPAVDIKPLTDLLRDRFIKYAELKPAIILQAEDTVEKARELLYGWQQCSPEVAIIHDGFNYGKELQDVIAEIPNIKLRHLFTSRSESRIYQRGFKIKGWLRGGLIGKGFDRQKNADYPDYERFSDLHLTFAEDGFDSFSDYTIVGSEFSERGGAAYAVALHLTYFDPARDNELFVYHFKSDSNDSPAEPDVKFQEALEKLMTSLDSGTSHLLETSAIAEFKKIYEHKSYPGLGYVKKLCMKHHVETVLSFLKDVHCE